MPRALCGVPAEHCRSNGVHDTCCQAFDCHVVYLLHLGYQQIGKREFVNPNDGSIRVLAKPRQFGGMSREITPTRSARRRLAAAYKMIHERK